MKFFDIKLSFKDVCRAPPEQSLFWNILEQTGVLLVAIITAIFWCSFIILVCASPFIIRFLYISNEKRQERISINNMRRVYVLPALNGKEPETVDEEDIVANEKYADLVNAVPNFRDNFDYMTDMDAFVRSQLIEMHDENIDPQD